MASRSLVWSFVVVFGVVVDGVYGQVGSRLPSSSTAAPGPNPTPSPVLLFHAIGTLTACSSAPITWVYDGPVGPLTLSVTNQNIDSTSTTSTSAGGVLADTTDGNDDPSTSLSKRKPSDVSPITETLTTSADPFSFAFNWPQVNVPQGNYIITASIQGTSTQSSVFAVINGTNLACLGVSAPSSSSTPPAPTSSNTQSSDGSGATSTQHRNSHVGAIVGGVVGGVAFILALAGCVLFGLRRRNLAKRSTDRGLGSRNWGGIQSTESTVEPKGASPASSTRSKKKTHNTSESVGAILGPSVNASAQGHSPSSSTGDIGTFGSLGTQSALSPPVNESPLLDNAGPFATPHQTNTTNPFEETIATSLAAKRTSRRASTSSHGHSSRPMFSPQSKRVSLDGYRPEVIPMAQSPSMGSSNNRRAARKAVPQYDASELELSSTPHEGGSLSSHGHTLLSSSYPGDSILTGPLNIKTANGSQSTLASYLGGTTSRVQSPPIRSTTPNGFGMKGEVLPADTSRPVHYLIPDMPSNSVSRS